MNDQLSNLRDCLLHEAAEMDRRCQECLEKDDAAWWMAFQHKRRALLLAAGWADAAMSGARPGKGGYSVAARQFHVDGKPLPTLPVVEPQRLAAGRIQVSAQFVPDGELDAVQQFECAAVPILGLHGISAVGWVGKNDCSVHGHSFRGWVLCENSILSWLRMANFHRGYGMMSVPLPSSSSLDEVRTSVRLMPSGPHRAAFFSQGFDWRFP